jgi:UDP-N-acetylglucosamine--N-acetylmuramyl-(pentapeptide) pyrophosphoryl-undecaprenol N-acetylglucosamine transferase
MPLAMAAADLVVARAGAATLGEFPAMALPSILVPYPYSGQHQEVNADYLVSRGAAVKLADADLDRQLPPTILALLEDPQALAALGRAASSLAQPDAADRIAAALLDLAG